MDKQIFRLVGKTMTLASMAYRMYGFLIIQFSLDLSAANLLKPYRRQGRPFVSPPSGMGYAESFLYMLDSLNEPNYRPHPVLVKALDVLFLLHADHELNCSTASALQVGSSLVDPYSSMSAATAALYGPLHGVRSQSLFHSQALCTDAHFLASQGANEAVIRMLISIGSPENVPSFIEKVKNKEVVLSGFGHRIYKTSDPRSTIIRK